MAPADPQGGGSKRNPVVLVVIGVVALLVAGLIGGLIADAINGNSSSSSGNSSNRGTASASSCDVTQVADQVLPSVVTIQARKGTTGGTGSGEVIDADGHILTNNHVIAVAADGGSITVTFANGETVPATLTGRDPLTDVAVIKVDEPNLSMIKIGSSGTLVVGQPVVVLGAPLGLSSTVTSGIVSALDRTITVPGEDIKAALLIDSVQTDAAINPGNSGGAMVNCAGEFVGMPSAGATVPTSSGEPSSGGSIGLGFAIPADLAIREADEIISTGTVTHAYVGIVAEPVSPNAQKVNGVAEGLLITSVDAGGPAAQAGLRAGDIITSIDGVAAVDTGQIVELCLRKRPGETVDFGYVRNGNEGMVTVTLGPQP